jgi:hypothetical protein
MVALLGRSSIACGIQRVALQPTQLSLIAPLLGRLDKSPSFGDSPSTGQRTRSGHGLPRIGCRIAFRGSQCRSERDLQVQLLLLAPGAIWQVHRHVQPLLHWVTVSIIAERAHAC